MNYLTVTSLLAGLAEQGFYGSIEVKYEAGQPVLIRKTETIKPGYRDTRGESTTTGATDGKDHTNQGVRSL